MTKTKRNIMLVLLAVGLLIAAPSIIISSIDTVRQSKQQDSKIQRMYNFDDIFDYFKVTELKDIKIVEEGDITSISLYGLTFMPVNFTDKSELAKNMRNYVPYLDFFPKWTQTMIAGGCDRLSANVFIKLQPKDALTKQISMSIQDKCFGHLEVTFTALNLSGDAFKAVKTDFLDTEFKKAATQIKTNDVKISASTQIFGKNYKEIALAEQSNVIGGDNELKEKALSAYSDLMKQKNVNANAQDMNYAALKKLLEISPAQWDEKSVNIGLQIHFTEPITLNKALDFIPNMVLTVE